jgi:AcrR family transcriptional regulator
MADLRLRADALRNRDNIISSAKEAFGECGLEASLDEIAKRAGVGSGTLYRHFPSRDDLITAVFLERMTENAAKVERALEAEDPWTAFSDYVRQTCREQVSDKGLADLMAIGHRSAELSEVRDRTYDAFVTLVGRAKDSGALRGDFSPEDIVLLLMANAGIIGRAGRVAQAASDRFVALTLDGFRADGSQPAPPPVSPIALLAALRRRTTQA